MRVSNSLIFNNLMRDIGEYQSRMEDLRDQISTSKRVRRPSDDPLAATRAVTLRALLARAEQHERNIEDARAWASATEEALLRAKDLLLEARDIALRGASDTTSREAREALANNVRELRKEFLTLANSKHEDMYIFSGFKTNNPAFALQDPNNPDSPIIYKGGYKEYKSIEVEPGSEMRVSVTGTEAFGADGSSVFDVLSRLIQDLENENADATAIASHVGELDERLDQVLRHASEMGVRAAHLDRAKERVQKDQINLAALLSKAEDADIAKDAVTLALQEEIYKNALAATARIVKPTLVDFLR